ncbi:MAG: sugar phosphate isomerase/epimerase [Clostridia bacterium]|nr:sugar phosphate isomerase/epimerase [Clostridia bacterium]MBQ4085536.1 sugar phosphate isomerase/epimerase [Clostridia bacterium]
MNRKGIIGVQMSTIAPSKMPAFDAYEVMGKLVDIGYRCAEISQVPMTKQNVQGFRKAIDTLGFTVSSLTASIAPMFPGMPGEYLSNPDDYKKYLDDARTLKCDLFRIGMMPMNAIGDVQKCIDFAKRAEEYALKLKEDGIDLYYHNHHIEFLKLDGRYLLDILRENAPHMGFELDTHWIHRGGENPVEFIKKYAGSVRLLHLKDYKIANVEMPDMSGPDGMQKFITAFFDKPVRFAELGAGSLPLKACIEAGLEGGAEYFLVEQDDSYGRDPFDCLRDSRDHLIALGYENWF